MTTRRLVILAAAVVLLAWQGQARAESLVTLRVLELGDAERWRAIGSVISTVTGAQIVILQEESTRKSKIARPDDEPLAGVKVLSISAHDVRLDLRGQPARLLITAGVEAGSESGLPAPSAPSATETEVEVEQPPAGPRRVRLTVDQFRESVSAVRRALLSGDIVLGENADGIFGVKIVNSPPGGLTERLGLKPGDVVVAINGRPAADETTATALLDAAAPDQSLPYAYRRGKEVGQGVVEIVSNAEP